MELMEMRRRLMMGMANGTKFATGTIEPTENVDNVSINIGFSCKALVIAVTDKTLVSGSRQFISLS